MKIAVISDIHGNLAALQAVLSDIARQGVDQTVNLGDLLSGPLQPAQTAELLMAQGFPTIRGNHERQLLDVRGAGGTLNAASSDGFAAAKISDAQAHWLQALPSALQLDADVHLCHGTPDSDLVYWLETVIPSDGDHGQHGDHGGNGIRPATADEVRQRLGGQASALVLCGHTHVPRIAACGDTLILNPGSVGLQAYRSAHPHPHGVETGAPHARYAVVERTTAGWQVDLRAVPYDHAEQARIAARRGRPDWAHALMTGRNGPA